MSDVALALLSKILGRGYSWVSRVTPINGPPRRLLTLDAADVEITDDEADLIERIVDGTQR